MILEKLKEYREFEEVRFEESNNTFYSNFEKEEYEDAIRKLKDYIRSGDVYIANMTRRIWCENTSPSFKIYEKLRSINKAPHSVKVTELFKIEEYATVFHLVSTVEGRLKDGASSIKCIKECFPGGSITGAPKIRAMEIIEELEGLKRNLYTGSIGYFDIRGNCDFNIVIRTIIKKDNRAYFGVGGGITWDSNPEDEWFETIDKAKALMKVL